MHTLKLLGGIALTGETGPVVGPAGQRKRLALLALLASTPGRSLSRDKILALLWPDSETAKARHLLADAVYELRSAIAKEAIRNVGDELVLDTSLLSTDIAEFQRLLKSGERREAVALYTGPFLDGFFLADAPDFERWAEEQRSRLANEYADALEKLAENSGTAGDHAASVEWWRRLAAHDPFSSRVALRLMRALASSGDSGAAIRHARVHEMLLREELQAALDPAVAALARQLQDGSYGSRVSAAGAPAFQSTPDPPTPANREPSSASIGVPTHPDRDETTGTDASRTVEKANRRLVWPALATGAMVIAVTVLFAAAREHDPRPVIRSIAVLPFENLAADSSQDYLAHGITDALITELARYPDLRISSRQSVTRYEGIRRGMTEIANELDVDGVVGGTILRDGATVRVNAQLIHAPSDRHLWAHRFERPITDLIALEREIAATIAWEVRVASRPVTAARSPARTRDTLAMEFYLRGRQAWRSRTPSGMKQAMLLFQDAVRRDSTFALAYAGLADAYRFQGGLNYGPYRVYRDSAFASVAHAIALDSTLSEAYATLGALLTDSADWAGAEVAFQRSIELDGNNALAHHWYGIMLATVNRREDALRVIRRGKQLDPHSSTLNGALNQIETWAAVPESLRTSRDRGRTLDPTNANARANNAVRLAKAGRCDDAEREIREAQALAPGVTVVALSEAGVHHFCGNSSRALALLTEVKRRPDARRSTVYIAMGHALLGESDSAFAWLEKEEAWGMAKRWDLRTAANLAPLRRDPRYPALLRRVGLEP